MLQSYLLSSAVVVAGSWSEGVCNREHLHFRTQQCLVSTGNRGQFLNRPRGPMFSPSVQIFEIKDFFFNLLCNILHQKIF